MATAAPKKTILHVIDSTEPGGAETVFVQLADEFRKRGYRCITVVSGPGWVTDELRRKNFEPVIIHAKGAFNLSLVRGLVRIVKDEKVDLIQSHLLGSNVYCALVGLLTRTPVVATFHGMVDVSPDERLRWLKFQIMNRGVRRFVTVSQRLAQVIGQEGLLNPKKTATIFNGIERGRYGRRRISQTREQLNLEPEAVLIGSLGNLHPAKGYDHLISAIPLVLKENPAAQFVVAGNEREPLLSQLKEQARQLNVAQHVHFLGFIHDAAEFLSGLDIFFLPSNSEGFSIAAIEALATGLPVVATRCGGPEEFLVHEQNALLVQVGDARAMAAGINNLLASSQLSRSLAESGTQLVSRAFSIEAMIRRYEDLYAEILNSA